MAVLGDWAQLVVLTQLESDLDSVALPCVVLEVVNHLMVFSAKLVPWVDLVHLALPAVS